MPRMGKATTVYLEYEPYQKLKRLLKARFGKPVSQELNEFIIRRVAELEGTQVQINADEYEDLKRKHFKLAKDVDVIEKRLDAKKVYDRLVALAQKVGLDFDGLRNVDEIAPKLLRDWDGTATDSEMFVTLLETAREKRQVERRLAEIRNLKGKT